jgi:two-component system LytT family sensor kinase
MKLSEFILSNNKQHVVSRHIAFMLVCGFIFFMNSFHVQGFSDYYNPKYYNQPIFSLISYFPVCIISVYTFSYLLIPRYLQTKRYALFLLFSTVLIAIMLAINYFTGMIFFSNNCADSPCPPFTSMQRLSLGMLNLIQSLGLTGVIAMIIVGKQWYFKQNENQVLTRKKIEQGLQLQKSTFFPKFLSSTLDNLHAKTTNGSKDSPDMLLQMADLLSYLLYESQDALVPLRKELNMLQNLILLEASNNKRINITTDFDAEEDNYLITPMLLFPLLQSGLQIANDNERRDVNILLQIKTQRNNLNFTLTGNFLENEHDYQVWEKNISAFKKQIELSDSHNIILKSSRNQEELTIHFQITLQPLSSKSLPVETYLNQTHEPV